MTVALYQIFNNQQELIEKNNAINELLGYPNLKTDTKEYRENDRIKKYNGSQYAGRVTKELEKACENMSSQQRLIYYDKENLKSYEWLKDNNWFFEEI